MTSSNPASSASVDDLEYKEIVKQKKCYTISVENLVFNFEVASYVKNDHK